MLHSPKEHADMLDRKWMLDWQSEQEKRREDWEKDEREKDRIHQKQLTEKADSTQRLILFLGIVALAISSIIGFLGIVSEGRGGVVINNPPPALLVATPTAQSVPDTPAGTTTQSP